MTVKLKTLVVRATVVVLLLLVAAITAAVLNGSAQRAYETIGLLVDLSRLGQTSARTTQAMMRAPLSYEVDGRSYQADVYRPLTVPRMAIVLLPGASPAGKNDPRLVEFAAWLASARFVVLVPDIARLRQLELRADIIPEVIDTLRYVSSTANLAPQGKTGIVAFSVAVGPALVAAEAPEVRDRVAFVLSIGGYYDLLSTLTFSITGYFRADGQWQHRPPQDLGKWVFVLSNADALPDRSDRELLAQMAKRRLADQDPSVLAPRLGREGQAVYRFVSNTDPEESRALFAALPPAIVAEAKALSPSTRDLSALHARVILVHGRDDAIIPYTESVALARALPSAQCTLVLVSGLYHVDLKPALLDSWYLGRAIYAVLVQRDRVYAGGLPANK
jgi:pimeloyl-ACP methyl ester carboxylesterase